MKESHFVYNMAYENESTPEKQNITDAGHDKQMVIIKEDTGREVTHWTHEGAKDLAELNRLIAKVDKSKGLSVDKERVQKEKEFALALGMPVSTACNLQCKFCYTDTHNNNNDELTLKDRLEIIDQAKEIGMKTIMTAMSGEPFCDPDFMEIIDYSHNLGFEYFVFTNLTRITPAIAHKLFEYNVGILGNIKETSLRDLISDKYKDTCFCPGYDTMCWT